MRYDEFEGKLRAAGFSRTRFAYGCGIDRRMVYRWAKRGRVPRWAGIVLDYTAYLRAGPAMVEGVMPRPPRRAKKVSELVQVGELADR